MRKATQSVLKMLREGHSDPAHLNQQIKRDCRIRDSLFVLLLLCYGLPMMPATPMS